MVTCTDKSGHIVLATKRTKRKTEAIVYIKGARRYKTFSNWDFDAKYKELGASVKETAKTWLISVLPMTDRVRRDLENMQHSAAAENYSWEAMKEATMAKAEKVEGAKRGAAKGPRGMDKEAVITILVEANPKKPSSASYARFELYKDGMTVGDAVAAGITAGDIRHDIAKGFIKID